MSELMFGVDFTAFTRFSTDFGRQSFAYWPGGDEMEKSSCLKTSSIGLSQFRS